MKELNYFGGLLIATCSFACGSTSDSKRLASDAGAPETGVDDSGVGSETGDRGSGQRGIDAGSSAGQNDAGSATLRDSGSSTPGDADVSADGAAPADAGDSVSCTPGAGRCAGDRAYVCGSSGDVWNTVECSTGCDGSGRCNPLSLETGWTVHQYQLTNDSVGTAASYSFENEGLVAVQSANPMASIYYNETELPESVVVTGRFSVKTTADDDLIGFVFGFQDPEHYYLFDWKQATQPDATCGTASEGASLKVVNAESELDDCTDFWQSSGTAKVTPIVGVDVNAEGWVDNADYDLQLVFKPGNISISVRSADGEEVVSISSDDETYSRGNFGFFNYSQEGVRYEFFSISPTD